MPKKKKRQSLAKEARERIVAIQDDNPEEYEQLLQDRVENREKTMKEKKQKPTNVKFSCDLFHIP